jgi:hypothetical protein
MDIKVDQHGSYSGETMRWQLERAGWKAGVVRARTGVSAV